MRGFSLRYGRLVGKNVSMDLIFCVLCSESEFSERTISRRHRNLSSLHLNNLTSSSPRSLLIPTNEVERTHTLSIQAQILTEALRDAELHAATSEFSNRPRVVLEVSGREALVR